MPEFALKDALNRYLQHGCSTFTKHEVLAYGGGDRRRVECCLSHWESRKLLQILKRFEEAADNDIVVKVLKMID